MAASRKIIEALLDDLAVAVNDTTVIYERYRVNPVEMESRNDIPRGRIALYEQSELVTTKVDAEKPNLSRQRYGLDISILRAYFLDDASQGELPLGDLRDSVVDWLRTVNASEVATQRIFTISYEGATGITRNKRYVTMTLNLSALRDLSTTQT